MEGWASKLAAGEDPDQLVPGSSRQRQKLIKKYQEANPNTPYAKAAVEVSRAHPELFK